jgi:uncharacterized protein (TIGR02145 family)
MAIVTDIDGNVYNTVIIGEQEWLVEDLKVTRSRQGGRLIVGNDFTRLNYLFNEYPHIISESDSNGRRRYGLYSILEKYTKMAPSGFHVARETDWLKLLNYIQIPYENIYRFSPSSKDNPAFQSLLPYFGEDNLINAEGNRGFWWALDNSTTVIGICKEYKTSFDRSTQNNYLFSVKCVRDVSPLCQTGLV